MARKSKLTEDVQARICAAIRMGATYAVAAGAGGIHYDTLRVWMRTKPAFSVALEAAEAEAALLWLSQIQEAARSGKWQAAAWMLERRYPQEYGKQFQRQQPEQGGPVTIRVVYDNDWRHQDLVALDTLDSARLIESGAGWLGDDAGEADEADEP